jgi:hypothetical protein
MIMRYGMPPQTLAAGLERRTGTTLYLRSDLQSSARQASRRAGLSLSRHIESLLLEEIAAHPSEPESGTVAVTRITKQTKRIRQ